MFKKGFQKSIPIAGLGTLLLCNQAFSTDHEATNGQELSIPFIAADTQQKTMNYEKAKPHDTITPSARGCGGVSGPYAFGSFIYWKNQLEKEDVANKVISTGPDNFFKVKQKEVDFKYSPGFKLGMGYNFKRDGWDALLRWTSLHSTKNRKSVSSSPIITAQNSELVYFPLPAILNNIVAGGQVHADWNLHFNTLDFELGRDFFISRNITLRPFLGLKADWIEWKFTNKYANFFNQSFTPIASFNTRLKEDNQGVGPRMGINSRWILSSCNFAIFGNLAGSLLYTDLKGKKTFETNPPRPSEFKTLGHRHELKPVIECLIGLDWNHCIRQHCNLYLSAGYEAQLWCDQTAADLYDSPFFFNGELHAIQSLMFQGLTASMRLDF